MPQKSQVLWLRDVDTVFAIGHVVSKICVASITKVYDISTISSYENCVPN